MQQQQQSITERTIRICMLFTTYTFLRELFCSVNMVPVQIEDSVKEEVV